MCGICGILNFDRERPVERAVIVRMTETMLHRGPDSQGIYLESGIGLGVRRLSIIDLATGEQPIENENGTMTIIFNGEIYNFRILKKGLESQGHRFKTNTDTEVILHAYEEHGEACLGMLRGMFAFAIWDKAKGELFIARDRLGIKPLYYFSDDKRFIFASEIKAILAAGDIPKKVNLRGLDEYLSLRYIIEPDTIFRDIFILEGGNYIRAGSGRITKAKYWDLNFSAEAPRYNESECIERVKGLLNESMHLHLISDVPVGAYLSGGIDSSSVVSLMQAQVSEPVMTFTVGYPAEDKKYSELKFAKAAAGYLKTRHEEVFMTAEDFRGLIPKYIRAQEQPLADSSLVPYYFISEYARQRVKVMLSGVGGDEFFFGYPEVYMAKINAQMNRLSFLSADLRKNVLDSYRRGERPAGIFMGLSKLIFFPVNAYVLLRYFEPHEKRELYSDAFYREAGTDNADAVIKRLEAGIPKHCTAYQQVLYLYVKTWLASNMLQGTDKVTMASSIEQRVPLLDHPLIEFLANVPFSLLFKDSRYKYLLKKTMQGRIPQAVIARKKMGFQTPEVSWYAGEMKDEIKNVLLDSSSLQRGYFNPDTIKAYLNGFEKRGDSDIRKVWLLYNLELWHRIFIDA